MNSICGREIDYNVVRAQCPVSPLSEVLGQGGEVAGVCPPVGPEVVEPGGVRPPGRQEGGPAGPAHSLLGVHVAGEITVSCESNSSSWSGGH